MRGNSIIAAAKKCREDMEMIERAGAFEVIGISVSNSYIADRDLFYVLQPSDPIKAYKFTFMGIPVFPVDPDNVFAPIVTVKDIQMRLAIESLNSFKAEQRDFLRRKPKN